MVRRAALLILAFANVAHGLVAKPIEVEVSNYPLFYFAGRLATDSFEVEFRIPEGIDPAFWNPTDQDLRAFQKADVILLSGATFEKWMKTVTLPRTSILDTSKEFSDQYLKSGEEVHRHGSGVAHSHEGTAIVTWLDMSLAAEQAEAIAERFAEEVPADEGAIYGNLEKLKEDLIDLDTRFKAVGRAWNNRSVILASHSIYHYMAEAYGFAIESLAWEWEQSLSSTELQEAERLIAKHSSKWVICEEQPSKDNETKIESLGLNYLVVASSSNRIRGHDWLEIMQRNASNLELILE
jgi:zinc transport system substrate-binding protein|tara:strand:+ start:14580 stop:15464 length:885 start_codon:yes stop_codon:yes gene_type:complete